MFDAVERGTASARQWAHLHDRCLAHAGSLQLYGTQYQLGPAGLERLPVRDPANLDRVRAEVGLPPAADVLKDLRRRMAAGPSVDGDRCDARTIELAGAA
ncbi:protein of unknown function [Streptomyces murinus]